MQKCLQKPPQTMCNRLQSAGLTSVQRYPTRGLRCAGSVREAGEGAKLKLSDEATAHSSQA